ncbi:hypothetical protein Q4596_00395 [Pseudoalteromonas carrageenovora]|uniref:hypothetical protein n=1 Tax=Pseudoalteromonas carrageenovora TaxID=227 RepID=UPI0026E21D31|nr:hypothetical protein [Pseudoalteromonas carrageenovora]MDO6834058.1 hypothetical protein [Pseudoalteromonas carrageenovora]
MMSLRKTNTLKTKKKLIEAFERIKSGTYTNRKLKNKKNVKVNAYNVEIEAGSSVGTLRNHPEIKEKIESYEPASINNENSTLLELRLSRALQKNKNLKAQLDKTRAELKRIKEESQIINDELDNNIVNEHELIVALMDNVEIDKCQTIFKKQDSHLTVIKHNFKTR